MNADSHSADEAAAGDKHSLPVGEAAATTSPVKAVDSPAPASAQQNISADLRKEPREHGEPKGDKPLVVRIIEDDELSSFERKTVTFGKWGITIAAVSLIAACIAAFAVYQQFKEAASQTDLLQIAAKQARRDSAAAGIRGQQEIAVLQAQATAAKNSVEAIQRQMRIDQRSWVKFEMGGETVEGKPEIKAMIVAVGQTPSAKIKFVNVGKGAARNLRGVIFVECVNSTKEPHLEMVESRKQLPRNIFVAGIMVPNAPAETTADRERWKDVKAKTVEPDPLTEPEFAALMSGKAYIATYGMIWYQDLFGNHWTKFCDWRTFANIPAQYQANKCTRYNDTDPN